jgi:hypothetical protein
MDYGIIKDVAGPIATVIASGAAAFVAYQLGKSQVDVARTQADMGNLPAIFAAGARWCGL